MDDPLPWALKTLPREGDAHQGHGPFTVGPGVLELHDRAGSHLVLHYMVE